MRASSKWLLGACGAIAVGALPAGCDWRAFDTLQNQAPVLAIDAPSDFPSSNDFGSVLLPVAPPMDGSSAAWFLASATQMTGLALVKLDASGGSSALKLTGSALDDLSGNPITAMAEIPGSGTGTALLGVPTVSELLTVELESQTVSPFIPSSPLTASDPLLGIGVAAGALTGTAAPDLIVASSSLIHVFVDGATSDITPGAGDLTSCPIALSNQLSTQSNRALVVGSLMASGPVIAIGTPGAATPGSVSFFTVTTSAVTCAGVLTAPALTSPAATANAGFGRTLAIGDFDGDHVADLLVGAPPYGVYLYKGPVAPGATPTATILAPQGSAAFGAALAAMSAAGMPGDEALVGDPGATLNGQTQAGNASIYTGASLTKTATMATPTSVLTDHEASAGEAYGSAVGALPFCAAAPCAAPPLLPLVGAPSKAFVYFTLGPTDPRAM